MPDIVFEKAGGVRMSSVGQEMGKEQYAKAVGLCC